MTVPYPPSRDALRLVECLTVVMEDCEVFGGQDGVLIDGFGCDVHIKDSIVRFAQSRGIFTNPFFTVEGVEIYDCRAYGMKTRAGCERIGCDNDIQAGPWDDVAPYSQQAWGNVGAYSQPKVQKPASSLGWYASIVIFLVCFNCYIAASLARLGGYF